MNDEPPVSSLFCELPLEIISHILGFVNHQHELYPLLTVSRSFLPLVAEQLWRKQTFFPSMFSKANQDYRKYLCFSGRFKKERLTKMPLVPYLDFITELNLVLVHPREQVKLLSKVPNCLILQLHWSRRIAYALMNVNHVVPRLLSLTFFRCQASSRFENEFHLLERILLKRAPFLRGLRLEGVPACFYQTFYTVLQHTQISFFNSRVHYMSGSTLEACKMYSHYPLPPSPYLQYCSISLDQLLFHLPFYFLDWVHACPSLQMFELHSDCYYFIPYYQTNLPAFVFFLQTFPSFSPLKKLILNNWHFDIHLNVIPSNLLPLNRFNTSLKSLKVFFLKETNPLSYETLIALLCFFKHLKHLNVDISSNLNNELPLNFRMQKPNYLMSFLTALSGLPLVSLKMALPNNLQRYSLPALKTMTSLKRVDLTLDVGCLYRFLPQLPQLHQFIFRPLKPTYLEVYVNQQRLNVMTYDNEVPIYIFERWHLELIRTTPLQEVRFIEISK